MKPFDIIDTLRESNLRLTEEVKALKSWNEDLLIDKLVLKEENDLLKKQIKELEDSLYEDL